MRARQFWELVFFAGLVTAMACKRELTQVISSPAQRLQAHTLMDFSEREAYWEKLSIAARERAWLYEELIQKQHLEQGMVVDRSLTDGRATAVCDSLLFSSLRYIALLKMGWKDRADQAWSGIIRANQGARWVRHPQCANKITSRDMIVGLLAALARKPPQHEYYLGQLARIIEETDGSVDPGPFYVSRLSPGIAEILRQLSTRAGIDPETLPAEVRFGFSTLEWDSWWGTPGYTSHLNALVFQLEYDLWQENYAFRTLGEAWRTPQSSSKKVIQPFKRFAALAEELAALDPQNLYFQWLSSHVRGELTLSKRIFLLEQLLAMPQFPHDRLPQNCDRKADYLWQRSSLEYRAIVPRCTEQFAGVDFLWMVAFLTER